MLTDNEIKKALECCSDYGLLKCLKCPKRGTSKVCMYDLSKEALDLINRQQAEIERLREENLKQKAILEEFEQITYPLPFETHFDNAIKRAKTEAIKEFAERLKEKAWIYQHSEEVTINRLIATNDIDNLVKEMVGDAE